MGLRRRRKNRRRREPRRFVDRPIAYALELIVCGTAFGAFGFYFLEFVHASPDFNVRTVEVHGAQQLDAASIVASSGVTGASNTLFLDRADLARRVERLAYVKTCAVAVVFPDTVVVRIVERRPFVTLLVNSRAYEVDDEGVVLREYASNELPAAPYITNVGGVEFVSLGARLEQAPLRAAIELWQAFAPLEAEYGVTVSEIAAPHEDHLRMYCDRLPYELRWGRGHFEAQVQRLAVLWDQKGLTPGCQTYLDLRFGEQLACK